MSIQQLTLLFFCCVELLKTYEGLHHAICVTTTTKKYQIDRLILIFYFSQKLVKSQVDIFVVRNE